MTNDKETLIGTLIQAYCVSNPDGIPCGWKGKGRMTFEEATRDGGRHVKETTVTGPDGSGRHHTFSIRQVPAP